MQGLSDTFERFLKLSGQELSIERNGQIIETVHGLSQKANNGIKYFGFRPDTDIQTGDWLINSVGERFYVFDKETQFTNGKPTKLKAYFETESQHETPNNSTSTVFNIANAQNSVIGNNNILNISYTEQLNALKESIDNVDAPDREEFSEIITLLELITKEKLPVKKGILSKFSDFIAKHSWFASQLTSLLLNWLTSQYMP